MIAPEERIPSKRRRLNGREIDRRNAQELIVSWNDSRGE